MFCLRLRYRSDSDKTSGPTATRGASHTSPLRSVSCAPSKPLIEHFRRQTARQWLYSSVEGLDGRLEFQSIGCHPTLAEVFKRVEFPAEE